MRILIFILGVIFGERGFRLCFFEKLKFLSCCFFRCGTRSFFACLNRSFCHKNVLDFSGFDVVIIFLYTENDSRIGFGMKYRLL